MLDVRNMTVRYVGLTAVDDLSFHVSSGEILTLMGPNGAGKSTAFNAIGGFVNLASGQVEFAGRPIAGVRPEQIAAMGIGRTFQNNGILREMSVLENVLCGLYLSTDSTFWGCIVGYVQSTRAERKAVRRARAMLDEFELGDLADRPAGDLSFGQQRMVEIARAMVGAPQLIMLDEPAVGLSPSERHHLGDMLRGFAADGIAILLVEHVQDLVMAVSDQVLVLNYGRKITQDVPEKIRKNKEVLEAYLGES